MTTVLLVAAKALGAFVGAAVLYVVVLVSWPGRPPRRLELRDDPALPGRQPVAFEVGGQTVRGRLYLPDTPAGPVPCVILSHGFGGTMDMALEPFAQRFREVGLAALTYDYRHFGQSDGEPRQLFSMASQLGDLRGAIAFARAHPAIDGDRIALWGTSAGGGYGLVLAAEDERIAAVCGQCAALDGRADSRLAIARDGYLPYLALIPHAQRDKGRSRLGLSPHTVQIVGRRGERALLIAPGAFEGYASLAPEGFVNEVCARLMLTHQGYDPIDYAPEVHCPVLILHCLQDNLVTREGAQAGVAALGPDAELREYPFGHFDIHRGDGFERAVSDQILFFSRHLLAAPAGHLRDAG